MPAVPAPGAQLMPCGQISMCTLEDVVLVVWRGPSTMDALRALIGTLHAQLEQYPDGVRYFAVVERSSTPPDREGRDLTVRAARELGPKLKAIATWVEGSARIEIAAALLNATLFLARSSTESRYFGNLERAMAWLAQYGPLDAPRTRDQIASMKRQLDSAGGAVTVE